MNTLKSLEICCGAGGMALGVHRAGFELAYACDFNVDALKTLRTYLQRQGRAAEAERVLRVDLKAHSPEDMAAGRMAAAWSRLIEKIGAVDLVCGGIPCQEYSTAGKGAGEHGERNLFPHALEVVRGVRPRAFLWENVKGLTTKKHVGYLQRVCGWFEELGYTVFWKVLDAADFSVLQHRERVMIVGFLDPAAAARFRYPEPTHTAEALVWAKWGTTGEERGGVEGGSYWSEFGLDGPHRDFGFCVDGGKTKMPPHRPMMTIDESATTQRCQHGGGGTGMLISGPAGTPGMERFLYADGTTSPIKGYALDPKHPPSDLDDAAAAVRSGGDGHTAPPAYLTSSVGPSKKEARLLAKILLGEVEVRGLRQRTVRDGISDLQPGLSFAHNDGTGSIPQSRRPMMGDAPALTIQGASGGEGAGGSYHGQMVRVIGAGTNPHSKGAHHERERRDITDEPATTTTAEQIGNRGPWVSTAREDHGVVDPDAPSCCIKAASGVDRRGHQGGAAPPAIRVTNHDPADQKPAPPGDAVRFLNQGASPHQVDAAAAAVRGLGGKGPELVEVEAGGWQRAAGAVGVDPRELATGLRRLLVREGARIQAFPDDMEFFGTKSAQYRSVGNALCPPLAEVMARAIREALEGP